MITSFRKIESQLKKLPLKQRAKLASSLIKSLDNLSPDEIEELWIEEAVRREKAVKKGKMKLIPAEEVFKNVSKILTN